MYKKRYRYAPALCTSRDMLMRQNYYLKMEKNSIETATINRKQTTYNKNKSLKRP